MDWNIKYVKADGTKATVRLSNSNDDATASMLSATDWCERYYGKVIEAEPADTSIKVRTRDLSRGHYVGRKSHR